MRIPKPQLPEKHGFGVIPTCQNAFARPGIRHLGSYPSSAQERETGGPAQPLAACLTGRQASHASDPMHEHPRSCEAPACRGCAAHSPPPHTPSDQGCSAISIAFSIWAARVFRPGV